MKAHTHKIQQKAAYERLTLALNGKQKKAREAIFISDKKDFKLKMVKIKLLVKKWGIKALV